MLKFIEIQYLLNRIEYVSIIIIIVNDVPFLQMGKVSKEVIFYISYILIFWLIYSCLIEKTALYYYC